MTRKLLQSWLIFILLTACKLDNPVPAPKDLVITVTPSTDGSGNVTIVASATGASFYQFAFGESKNESAQKSLDGQITHKYSKSGTFNIIVSANASDDVFITDSKTVNVEIFDPTPQTGYATPTSYAGKSLLWADEFSGTSLSSSNWSFENGDGCPNVCGWGNNELEYYQKDNTSVADGYLVITARRQNVGGKSFTSSRLISKGNVSFKFGRVDVRAVLPKGQGIWPAIWMLGSNIDAAGWPKSGEIDIMEMIGGAGKENTVYGTAHWANDNGSHASSGSNYSLPEGIFSNEFHVFSIAWDSTRITWYVDDIEYASVDITPAELSELRNEFFFILNVAVGGSWPGNPNDNTIFPQRMVIDYIRVFQNQ